VVGNGVLVRLGAALGTLLGPEGTTCGLSFSAVTLLLCGVGDGCQAWPGLANGILIGGVEVWGCGLWVGRLLRIAQWTRASLWSSCQGRTVDALAPGADEGRGRPR
jgi:hypothetical protein